MIQYITKFSVVAIFVVIYLQNVIDGHQVRVHPTGVPARVITVPTNSIRTDVRTYRNYRVQVVPNGNVVMQRFLLPRVSYGRGRRKLLTTTRSYKLLRKQTYRSNRFGQRTVTVLSGRPTIQVPTVRSRVVSLRKLVKNRFLRNRVTVLTRRPRVTIRRPTVSVLVSRSRIPVTSYNQNKVTVVTGRSKVITGRPTVGVYVGRRRVPTLSRRVAVVSSGRPTVLTKSYQSQSKVTVGTGRRIVKVPTLRYRLVAGRRLPYKLTRRPAVFTRSYRLLRKQLLSHKRTTLVTGRPTVKVFVGGLRKRVAVITRRPTVVRGRYQLLRKKSLSRSKVIVGTGRRTVKIPTLRHRLVAGQRLLYKLTRRPVVVTRGYRLLRKQLLSRKRTTLVTGRPTVKVFVGGSRKRVAVITRRPTVVRRRYQLLRKKSLSRSKVTVWTGRRTVKVPTLRHRLVAGQRLLYKLTRRPVVVTRGYRLLRKQLLSRKRTTLVTGRPTVKVFVGGSRKRVAVITRRPTVVRRRYQLLRKKSLFRSKVTVGTGRRTVKVPTLRHRLVAGQRLPYKLTRRPAVFTRGYRLLRKQLLSRKRTTLVTGRPTVKLFVGRSRKRVAVITRRPTVVRRRYQLLRKKSLSRSKVIVGTGRRTVKVPTLRYRLVAGRRLPYKLTRRPAVFTRGYRLLRKQLLSRKRTTLVTGRPTVKLFVGRSRKRVAVITRRPTVVRRRYQLLRKKSLSRSKVTVGRGRRTVKVPTLRHRLVAGQRLPYKLTRRPAVFTRGYRLLRKQLLSRKRTTLVAGRPTVKVFVGGSRKRVAVITRRPTVVRRRYQLLRKKSLSRSKVTVGTGRRTVKVPTLRYRLVAGRRLPYKLTRRPAVFTRGYRLLRKQLLTRKRTTLVTGRPTVKVFVGGSRKRVAVITRRPTVVRRRYQLLRKKSLSRSKVTVGTGRRTVKVPTLRYRLVAGRRLPYKLTRRPVVVTRGYHLLRKQLLSRKRTTLVTDRPTVKVFVGGSRKRVAVITRRPTVVRRRYQLLRKISLSRSKVTVGTGRPTVKVYVGRTRVSSARNRVMSVRRLLRKKALRLVTGRPKVKVYVRPTRLPVPRRHRVYNRLLRKKFTVYSGRNTVITGRPKVKVYVVRRRLPVVKHVFVTGRPTVRVARVHRVGRKRVITVRPTVLRRRPYQYLARSVGQRRTTVLSVKKADKLYNVPFRRHYGPTVAVYRTVGNKRVLVRRAKLTVRKLRQTHSLVGRTTGRPVVTSRMVVNRVPYKRVYKIRIKKLKRRKYYHVTTPKPYPAFVSYAKTHRRHFTKPSTQPRVYVTKSVRRRLHYKHTKVLKSLITRLPLRSTLYRHPTVVHRQSRIRLHKAVKNRYYSVSTRKPSRIFVSNGLLGPTTRRPFLRRRLVVSRVPYKRAQKVTVKLRRRKYYHVTTRGPYPAHTSYTRTPPRHHLPPKVHVTKPPTRLRGYVTKSVRRRLHYKHTKVLNRLVTRLPLRTTLYRHPTVVYRQSRIRLHKAVKNRYYSVSTRKPSRIFVSNGLLGSTTRRLFLRRRLVESRVPYKRVRKVTVKLKRRKYYHVTTRGPYPAHTSYTRTPPRHHLPPKVHVAKPPTRLRGYVTKSVRRRLHYKHTKVLNRLVTRLPLRTTLYRHPTVVYRHSRIRLHKAVKNRYYSVSTRKPSRIFVPNGLLGPTTRRPFLARRLVKTRVPHKRVQKVIVKLRRRKYYHVTTRRPYPAHTSYTRTLRRHHLPQRVHVAKKSMQSRGYVTKSVRRHFRYRKTKVIHRLVSRLPLRRTMYRHHRRVPKPIERTKARSSVAPRITVHRRLVYRKPITIPRRSRVHVTSSVRRRFHYKRTKAVQRLAARLPPRRTVYRHPTRTSKLIVKNKAQSTVVPRRIRRIKSNLRISTKSRSGIIRRSRNKTVRIAKLRKHVTSTLVPRITRPTTLILQRSRKKFIRISLKPTHTAFRVLAHKLRRKIAKVAHRRLLLPKVIVTSTLPPVKRLLLKKVLRKYVGRVSVRQRPSTPLPILVIKRPVLPKVAYRRPLKSRVIYRHPLQPRIGVRVLPYKRPNKLRVGVAVLPRTLRPRVVYKRVHKSQFKSDYLKTRTLVGKKYAHKALKISPRRSVLLRRKVQYFRRKSLHKVRKVYIKPYRYSRPYRKEHVVNHSPHVRFVSDSPVRSNDLYNTLPYPKRKTKVLRILPHYPRIPVTPRKPYNLPKVLVKATRSYKKKERYVKHARVIRYHKHHRVLYPLRRTPAPTRKRVQVLPSKIHPTHAHSFPTRRVHRRPSPTVSVAKARYFLRVKATMAYRKHTYSYRRPTPTYREEHPAGYKRPHHSAVHRRPVVYRKPKYTKRPLLRPSNQYGHYRRPAHPTYKKPHLVYRRPRTHLKYPLRVHMEQVPSVYKREQIVEIRASGRLTSTTFRPHTLATARPSQFPRSRYKFVRVWPTMTSVPVLPHTNAVKQRLISSRKRVFLLRSKLVKAQRKPVTKVVTKTSTSSVTGRKKAISVTTIPPRTSPYKFSLPIWLSRVIVRTTPAVLVTPTRAAVIATTSTLRPTLLPTIPILTSTLPPPLTVLSRTKRPTTRLSSVLPTSLHPTVTVTVRGLPGTVLPHKVVTKTSTSSVTVRKKAISVTTIPPRTSPSKFSLPLWLSRIIVRTTPAVLVTPTRASVIATTSTLRPTLLPTIPILASTLPPSLTVLSRTKRPMTRLSTVLPNSLHPTVTVAVRGLPRPTLHISRPQTFSGFVRKTVSRYMSQVRRKSLQTVTTARPPLSTATIRSHLPGWISSVIEKKRSSTVKASTTRAVKSTVYPVPFVTKLPRWIKNIIKKRRQVTRKAILTTSASLRFTHPTLPAQVLSSLPPLPNFLRKIIKKKVRRFSTFATRSTVRPFLAQSYLPFAVSSTQPTQFSQRASLRSTYPTLSPQVLPSLPALPSFLRKVIKTRKKQAYTRTSYAMQSTVRPSLSLSQYDRPSSSFSFTTPESVPVSWFSPDYQLDSFPSSPLSRFSTDDLDFPPLPSPFSAGDSPPQKSASQSGSTISNVVTGHQSFDSFSFPPSLSSTPSTPFSLPPSPFSTPSTPFSLPPSLSSTPSTPFSLPPLPFSTPSTPFSLPPSLSSTPSTPFSLPPSPFSTPSTPFSLPPSLSSTPSTPFSLPPSLFSTPSTPFSVPPSLSSTPSTPFSLPPSLFSTPSTPFSVPPSLSSTPSTPFSLPPSLSSTPSTSFSLLPSTTPPTPDFLAPETPDFLTPEPPFSPDLSNFVSGLRGNRLFGRPRNSDRFDNGSSKRTSFADVTKDFNTRFVLRTMVK